MSRSSLDRGLDAFARKNWTRAREQLEEAMVEDGSATGEYHLGVLYWRGLGGERDQAAAVDCFARAAESGLPAAQTAYALALRSGIGAVRNDHAARQLFRSAAGAGDLEAMTQLAAMSDSEEALRWLRRASEQGHAPAMTALAEMLIATDPVDALTWLYVAVSVTGQEAVSKRAQALAREMTAREIDAAERAGRTYVKNFRKAKRRR
ncbi:tetratricopeptide repeat protein [Terricaulis sp.]|uniref:tetratricopeptide repeat protein n=1 Tax=Terricaulis sp. TaxID=2768686 RepID=UPI003783D184